MKTGDHVQARLAGTDHWVTCRVDMCGGNGRSLVLSADEGLPLVLIDPATGRQNLLLSVIGGDYFQMGTQRQYEVRVVGLPKIARVGSSYITGYEDGREWIKCLVCGKTSHNPHDATNLYCGFCRKFHSDHERESIEQVRRITSKTAEGLGWNVVFECGHTVWWAIEPPAPAANCALCFDELLTLLRRKGAS